MMRVSAQGASTDDAATLISIGAIAAVLAMVAHETLGHGIGCIAAGGQITLLTSIWFRCLGASWITDIAGPIGNVFAVVAAMLAWWAFPRMNSGMRVFLTLFAGINLFWFCGQIVYSAALDIDDVAFVAHALDWPPYWRAVAIAAGVAMYAAGVHGMARLVRGLVVEDDAAGALRRRVGIAHGAAAACEGLMGLLWAKDPWGSAFNALLAVGVAPGGLWLALLRAERGGVGTAMTLHVARSAAWIFTGAVVCIAFAWLQARGIGPLS
jgi:hypothetical protein